MKNRKRFLCIALMSVLAVTAKAQQYAPESDFSAKIINNGRGVEIIKYTGSRQTVNIPPMMEWIPITSIGREAFSDNASLTSVTFQGRITNFGFNYNGIWVSPFQGDLRDKYLAGGIGTYKTTAPVSEDSVWRKQ